MEKFKPQAHDIKPAGSHKASDNAGKAAAVAAGLAAGAGLFAAAQSVTGDLSLDNEDYIELSEEDLIAEDASTTDYYQPEIEIVSEPEESAANEEIVIDVASLIPDNTGTDDDATADIEIADDEIAVIDPLAPISIEDMLAVPEDQIEDPFGGYIAELEPVNPDEIPVDIATADTQDEPYINLEVDDVIPTADEPQTAEDDVYEDPYCDNDIASGGPLTGDDVFEDYI